MIAPAIEISQSDAQQLTRMLDQAVRERQLTREDTLQLRQELARATIVPRGGAASPDVVSMNSTVELLDLDTGAEETWTVVFPEKADAAAGKISVLAPIGTGVLGYRVGDVFTWEVPAGIRRLQIRSITLPES